MQNQINGTRKSDTLSGTDLNDFITGKNGDDIIEGKNGDDIIEGGRGGDIIYGNAGNDVLAADRVDRFDDYSGTVSELWGGDGNDSVFGGRKDDLIDGGNDSDVLVAKAGNDIVRGAAGNDSLEGGIGNDNLDGGDDIDTVDYSNLVINGVFGIVAGLDINLDQNTATHSSTNNALTWRDTVTNVENVLGTQRNDRLIGDSGNNLLDGQAEVGRDDRQTTFTDLDGDIYQVTGDVVEYQGDQSEFTFTQVSSGIRVTSNTIDIGTDTLTDIEFLKFDDGLSAIDDLNIMPEPEIAFSPRGGVGYNWGSFNGSEFVEEGSFVLLTENENGDPITNTTSENPEFTGFFEDAVLFGGSTNPNNLTDLLIELTRSGILTFSFGNSFFLELNGSNIPNSTAEVLSSYNLSQGTVVDMQNGNDLGFLINNLGTTEVQLDSEI